MKTSNIIYLLLVSLLLSCSQQGEPPVLLSPSINYSTIESIKYITDKTESPDSVINIHAVRHLGKKVVFVSDSGIYLINHVEKELEKFYKFNKTAHELYQKHYYLSVDMHANMDCSKILITTSSGQSSTAIGLQIDVESGNIDWMFEHSKQISTSTYSQDSKIIAIGTSYEKKDSGKYVASLFMIDSESGEFTSYIRQGQSMRQVSFSENDQYIHSVLGWPHVDTYVWGADSLNEYIGAFGKDQTAFYESCSIDKNRFVSIGQGGVYLWNYETPSDTKIVCSGDIPSKNRLFNIRDNQTVVYVDYISGMKTGPLIKYFDYSFNHKKDVQIGHQFNEVEFSLNRNLLTGVNYNRDEMYCFDIVTESFEKYLTKSEINQIVIKAGNNM